MVICDSYSNAFGTFLGHLCFICWIIRNAEDLQFNECNNLHCKLSSHFVLYAIHALAGILCMCGIGVDAEQNIHQLCISKSALTPYQSKLLKE